MHYTLTCYCSANVMFLFRAVVCYTQKLQTQKIICDSSVFSCWLTLVTAPPLMAITIWCGFFVVWRAVFNGCCKPGLLAMDSLNLVWPGMSLFRFYEWGSEVLLGIKLTTWSSYYLSSLMLSHCLWPPHSFCKEVKCIWVWVQMQELLDCCCFSLLFFETGFHVAKLTSNSWSSILHFPSAGITVVYHSQLLLLLFLRCVKVKMWLWISLSYVMVRILVFCSDLLTEILPINIGIWKWVLVESEQ